VDEAGLTASAVIDYVQELENDSAAFYADLAERFDEHQGKLLSYASASKKNRSLVTRTYQETISDALEACFCFEGLPLGENILARSVPETSSLPQALQEAIQLEESATRFYLAAAERSQSLLATVTRAFSRVARTRDQRRLELETLLEKATQDNSH
jgi:rubrerythrin